MYATGELYTHACECPEHSSPQRITTRKLQALDIESPVSPTRGPIPIPAMSNALKHAMSAQGLPSPPNTPLTKTISNSKYCLSLLAKAQEPIPTPLSYEFDLDQGQLIGSGLWSKVYSIRVSRLGPFESSSAVLTPPSTPERVRAPGLPTAYAVKVASRSDAVKVFEDEARILTHLQQHTNAQQYIVPFYGFGMSHTALVFEAANPGDLSSLINPSTPLPAILAAFPSLARQLIAGLSFIHSAGVIHADIKPANILLSTLPNTADLHARYCDFSASSLTTEDSPNSAAHGGGTWAFMAPEQLLSSPSLNTPTSASDVYALALTLLTYLLSASPFADLENNVFMLREAVKSGEPLSFADMSMHGANRLAALRGCQEGRQALEWLKGGLVKRREGRLSAEAWCGVVGVDV